MSVRNFPLELALEFTQKSRSGEALLPSRYEYGIVTFRNYRLVHGKDRKYGSKPIMPYSMNFLNGELLQNLKKTRHRIFVLNRKYVIISSIGILTRVPIILVALLIVH